MRPELRAIDGGRAALPSIAGIAPPSDLGAEQDLLGELFNHPDGIAIARGLVEPGDFVRPLHQRIFQAMCDIDDDLRSLGEDRPMRPSGERVEVSVGMVLVLLKDRQQCEDLHSLVPGGPPEKTHHYLLELRDIRASSWGRFEAICRRVKSRSRLRDAARFFHRELAEIYTAAPTDEQAYLDRVAAEMRSLAYAGRSTALSTAAEAQASFDGRTRSTSGLLGLSTGLDDLDELTGGWQDAETWLISGPPGGGKTAFILGQLADTAAIVDEDGGQRHGGLFMSLEMPKELAIARARLRDAMVDLRLGLKHPEQLTTEQLGRLDAAAERINAMPLLIDDRKSLTVDQIRGSAHRARKVLQQKWGARLSMIGIDYFQLTGSNPRVGRNPTREAELNRNGLELVHLSEELDVPVLLGAQLNGAGEIRECTAMRQHAQNWLDLKVREPKPGEAASATLKLRKHRNGPPGKVDCWFHGAVQRFSMEDWL